MGELGCERRSGRCYRRHPRRPALLPPRRPCCEWPVPLPLLSRTRARACSDFSSLVPTRLPTRRPRRAAHIRLLRPNSAAESCSSLFAASFAHFPGDILSHPHSFVDGRLVAYPSSTPLRPERLQGRPFLHDRASIPQPNLPSRQRLARNTLPNKHPFYQTTLQS